MTILAVDSGCKLLAMAQAPTYRFQDDTLYLTSRGSEMRLRWSPEPVAEQRSGQGQWTAFLPDFRVIAPTSMEPVHQGDLHAKHEAFRAFRSEIPADIAGTVEPFSCHQWPLLILAKQSPAGMDLLKANPVLAYALANNAQIRATPSHAAPFQAARHTHQRQRDIAGWLGFPATDAAARLFKKIPQEIAYPGLIRKFQQCTKSPAILKVLGHLPVLTEGVIFLCSDPDIANLLKPKLIQEVATAEDEVTVAPTADMLFELMAAATEMNQVDKLKPFSSRLKVLEAHERVMSEYDQFRAVLHRQKAIREAQRRLTTTRHPGKLPLIEREMVQRLQAEYNQLETLRPDRVQQRLPVAQPPPAIILPPFLEADQLRTRQFPPPPFAGTETIIPLTTFADLEQEAREMENCLARNTLYANRVLSGGFYLYRVVYPERYTLAIVQRGPTTWAISELRRAGNLPALPEAITIVEHWLDTAQPSLSSRFLKFDLRRLLR